MGRGQLYKIVAIACAAGYAWLAFLQFKGGHPGHEMNVCLIKNVTDIPCPSCGATRSVLAIMEGDFREAMHWNPVGFLLVTSLIIIPLWILFDVFFSKDSFLLFYRKVESAILNKWIAIPMTALVIANWIWNIIKGV